MGTPESKPWRERGRTHQAEGRAIDAMICFRRAARLDPRGADTRFHLGEVCWQLALSADAIAAWQEALSVDPRHFPAACALAESLLATGDWRAARDAADRALTLFPHAARITAIRGIALLALGEAAADPSHAAAILKALARKPKLLSVPTIAAPLAAALDAAAPGPMRNALLDGLASMGAALGTAPARLVAAVVERAFEKNAGNDAAVADLLGVASTRAYAFADHGAMRRLAMAARRIDRALALSYARLCVSGFSAPVPLMWPRRTAGERLRVLAVLPALVEDPEAAAAVHELTALAPAAFDVAFAAIGSTPAQGPSAIALPDEPDAQAARYLAVRDADVLIDLAGLAANAGPLLAQRPAREIWTIATLALPNVAPLVDRTLPTPDALAPALRERYAALDSRSGCSLDPADMGTAWQNAVMAHQRGDRAAALERYGEILALQPGFVPALFLLAKARRDEGDREGARAAYAAALANAPAYVDARAATADVATELGDADAAVALCVEGLARDAASVALWRRLGLAHLARRDGDAAAEAFERALALDMTDGETHYNHGVALQMRRRTNEAARAYQRALAMRPDLTDAEFNLAVLFQEMRATDAAIAAYESVLKADPRRTVAYKNLGEVLAEAGRINAWLENFRRFEANCPDALPLAVQALEVCHYAGDFAKIGRYVDGLRREQFKPADEIELVDCLEELLFLLLYFDVEPDLLRNLALTYDAAARHVYGGPFPRSAVRRPGKLRVGYLSADLRNHVMGKMMWSAVEHHDKSRFELFFYSLSAEEDRWTERFRGLADHYEVIADLSERTAAQQIAADDLDLLVDLSTNTKGSRPGILAFKPARVQITHVASAGTVGLSTIDYKLTDRYADVPANAEFQQEALLSMDGCVYPYRHIAPAAAHPFHREALGIPADAVVIGAFVTALKLSQRCLMLWREALMRIPRARLAFSPRGAAFRDGYERLAAAAGIGPDRLLFLPQGRDDAENQARYALVDFVLDPMPYGGVNGTLEALDMGVPVVTLVGKRHGERTSYSILANLGVVATVAQSGREYVDIAVRLAEDPAFMRDVRAAIRAGIARSPLTDMPAHTQALERAYVAALAARAPEALAGAGERGDG